MAQSKHCPYSFYVPENDAQLMRFVKSQSNLSLSVRLLMKAFLSAYKGEIQDVAAADLSDLIRGVRLENIPGLQAAAQEAVTRAASETYEDTREEEQEAAPSADAAPEDREAEPSAGPAQHEPGTDGPPAQAAGELRDPESGPDREQEDEPAGEPAAQRAPEPEAGPETEPVPVPEVVAEPERPVRTVDSQRTAYNESRLPSKKATEDDLMAMMGDNF